MFQFPGLLGHSGLDARWAAPPDFSQPSTPDLLMTPRHPPRALRSLTTPIGPPLLPVNPEKPEPPKDASIDPTGHFTEALENPAQRLATRWLAPEPLMLSVRVHLTRPARHHVERSRFSLYCSGDCHSPYCACDRSRPGKTRSTPPHAGVCFVCDQHRIAKKLRPEPRHRREGGPQLKSFLVWPGGEAVNHGPAPRPAGSVDCIAVNVGQAFQPDFQTDVRPESLTDLLIALT